MAQSDASEGTALFEAKRPRRKRSEPEGRVLRLPSSGRQSGPRSSMPGENPAPGTLGNSPLRDDPEIAWEHPAGSAGEFPVDSGKPCLLEAEWATTWLQQP